MSLFYCTNFKIFCNLISEVNIDMFGVRSPRGWINKIYWLNFSSPKETGSRRSKFLNFSKIPIINLYNEYVQINPRDSVVFRTGTNCSDHRVLRVTFHNCNREKLYFARIGPTCKPLYLRIALMLRFTVHVYA